MLSLKKLVDIPNFKLVNIIIKQGCPSKCIFREVLLSEARLNLFWFGITEMLFYTFCEEPCIHSKDHSFSTVSVLLVLLCFFGEHKLVSSNTWIVLRSPDIFVKSDAYVFLGKNWCILHKIMVLLQQYYLFFVFGIFSGIDCLKDIKID